MSEEVKTQDESNLYDSIKAEIYADVKRDVLADVQKSLSRKAITVPATPKEDEGSFNEWVCNVAKTYRTETRDEGFQVLTNKYG